MSATIVRRRIRSPLFYRLQRYAVEAACLAFGFVLVVWSVTPIYNMWMIALDSHDDVFSGSDLARQPDRWKASASSSPRTSGILRSSGISSATASSSACR